MTGEREERGERRGRKGEERGGDVPLGKNIFHSLMSLCNTPELIPSALKLLDESMKGDRGRRETERWRGGEVERQRRVERKGVIGSNMK